MRKNRNHDFSIFHTKYPETKIKQTSKTGLLWILSSKNVTPMPKAIPITGPPNAKLQKS